MLTISPRKVRQISDPILQMLHILHKVIYISQLPPTLGHNPRRRIIERFKRVLFAPPSTSVNLKSELKKLLNGSREIIEINFGPSTSPGLSRQASREQEARAAEGKGKEIACENYTQHSNYIHHLIHQATHHMSFLQHNCFPKIQWRPFIARFIWANIS